MGFEIERLKNYNNEKLNDWEKIGFVNGYGTTTETQTYSFKGPQLSVGKYQYRLKQMDFNGSFEFSNVVEVEIGSPNKFVLEQNFPNPFNPYTIIRYTIPNAIYGLSSRAASREEGVQVQLKIFDVLGNEVATLVNENKTAGNYEIEFSASNLSSGIYFYKFQAGAFIQTKKMILLQ